MSTGTPDRQRHNWLHCAHNSLKHDICLVGWWWWGIIRARARRQAGGGGERRGRTRGGCRCAAQCARWVPHRSHDDYLLEPDPHHMAQGGRVAARAPRVRDGEVLASLVARDKLCTHVVAAEVPLLRREDCGAGRQAEGVRGGRRRWRGRRAQWEGEVLRSPLPPCPCCAGAHPLAAWMRGPAWPCHRRRTARKRGGVICDAGTATAPRGGAPPARPRPVSAPAASRSQQSHTALRGSRALRRLHAWWGAGGADTFKAHRAAVAARALPPPSTLRSGSTAAPARTAALGAGSGGVGVGVVGCVDVEVGGEVDVEPHLHRRIGRARGGHTVFKPGRGVVHKPHTSR